MSDNAEQSSPPINARVADVLAEVAELLEEQGANPFRVRAYREGAKTIRRLPRSVAEIVDNQGVDALLDLPGIGRSLSNSIEHLVHSGRLPLLERLRGEHEPEHLFATVADIGPKLAAAIHQHLGIETLQELAASARDGRLAKVPGMGKKRLQAVRESLAGRFRGEPSVTIGRVAEGHEIDRSVPVEELLDIDRQYRRLAKQGRLPRVAPRQFNPTREAWLPILHTERDERHYTAMYSNTAHAHQAGATHDWVIIYRDDDQHGGPWTVITAYYGRLQGQRVVRGRESECQAKANEHPPNASGPSERKHQKTLGFGDEVS